MEVVAVGRFEVHVTVGDGLAVDGAHHGIQLVGGGTDDSAGIGQLDAVLEALKPGWDSTDSLWPIPEKELLANPFLKPQNPGY